MSVTAAEADVYGLPRPLQHMYVLNGVPYVPHYKARGFYVRPGLRSEHIDNRIKTSTQLLCEGATPVRVALWPRDYSKEQHAEAT